MNKFSLERNFLQAYSTLLSLYAIALARSTEEARVSLQLHDPFSSLNHAPTPFN